MSTKQLLALKNPDDFEDLCCLLYGREWNDANTKRNGRSGQPQAGVDVYGQKNGEAGHWVGVQCKQKDGNLRKKLTKKDVDDEIKNAKTFVPSLREFTFATTAPKDAAIEEYVRQKSDELVKEGLFRVHVSAWEDIALKLSLHKDLMVRFDYSEDSVVLKVVEDLSKQIAGLQAAKTENNPDFEKLFDLWTEQIIKLLDDGYVDQAMTLLNAIEPLAEAWGTLFKYKVMSYKAAAYITLDNSEEGASLYIRAVELAPERENALANASLGHLIKKNFAEAIRLANLALEKNPKNLRANSMIIQASQEKPLAEVIASLDSAILSEPEICFSIGNRYAIAKDMDNAEIWLRKGVQNDTQKLTKLRALLAECLLVKTIKDRPVVEAADLTYEEKIALEEIEKLYKEMFEEIKGKEIERTYLMQIRNLALINRSLGDHEDAMMFIDVCLKHEPGNRRDLTIKAELLRFKGDTDQAITLLKTYVQPTDEDQAPLILGDSLREKGFLDEAKDLAEKFIPNQKDPELLHQAHLLLTEVLIAKADFKAAAEVNEQALSKKPQDVRLLVNASRISKMAGDIEEAGKKLIEAKNALNAATHPSDRRLVADAFYFLGKYEDAIELYKAFADARMDDLTVQRLLNCYYRLGKNADAKALATEIIKIRGNMPFVSEVAAEIEEQIGNLAGAKKICEDYLKEHAADAKVKLRLARLHARSLDNAGIEKVIGKDFNVDALEAWRDKFMAALLYDEIGDWKKGLKIAYEARHDNHKDPEAHLMYIMFFLNRDKSHDSELIPTQVTVDTAVQIENGAGEKEWYIIEEKRTSPFANEIDLSHAMAKKLIAKKAGENFKLIEDEFSSEPAKVLIIQSKYSHGFQESQMIFTRACPEDPRFRTIFVGDVKEGEIPPAFKAMLEHTDKRIAFFEKVDEHYQAAGCTIGALGTQTGNSVYEGWHGLAFSEGKKIHTATGNAKTLEAAGTLIASKKMPILDPVSLFTIFHVGIEEEVAVFFKEQGKKIGIGQHTIDLLNHKLSNLSRTPAAGYMGGTKQPYIEACEKQQQEEKARLEKQLAWIKANCEICPCNAALTHSKENREKLEDVLGEESAEALLIASEEDKYLFSDDLVLRSIAKQMFKTDGIWTQALLSHWHEQKRIENAVYAKHVLSLIAAGYVYTSIDEHVLIEAARQAGWSAGKPFTTLHPILKTSETNSVIRLLASFIYQLNLQMLLTPLQKQSLIVSALEAASTGKDKNEIASKLANLLARKFRLLPLAFDEALSIVLAWRESHL